MNGHGHLIYFLQLRDESVMAIELMFDTMLLILHLIQNYACMIKKKIDIAVEVECKIKCWIGIEVFLL